MKVLAHALAAAIVVSRVAVAGPPTVDEDTHPLCPYLVDVEQRHVEDLGLELQRAGPRLTAAEEIFKLVDQLWNSDAIERLAYVTAKYDRDVARAHLEHLRARVARQESVVAQYLALCDALSSGGISDQEREAVAREFQRYTHADCEANVHSAKIAELDVAYEEELVASVRDLREHAVATAQDLIRAERDLEQARKSLEDATRRAEGCRETQKGS